MHACNHWFHLSVYEWQHLGLHIARPTLQKSRVPPISKFIWTQISCESGNKALLYGSLRVYMYMYLWISMTKLFTNQLFFISTVGNQCLYALRFHLTIMYGSTSLQFDLQLVSCLSKFMSESSGISPTTTDVYRFWVYTLYTVYILCTQKSWDNGLQNKLLL